MIYKRVRVWTLRRSHTFPPPPHYPHKTLQSFFRASNNPPLQQLRSKQEGGNTGVLLHAVQRGVTVHNYSKQERIQLYILCCSEYVQDYLGSRYRQHESKSTVNSIRHRHLESTPAFLYSFQVTRAIRGSHQFLRLTQCRPKCVLSETSQRTDYIPFVIDPLYRRRVQKTLRCEGLDQIFPSRASYSGYEIVPEIQ